MYKDVCLSIVLSCGGLVRATVQQRNKKKENKENKENDERRKDEEEKEKKGVKQGQRSIQSKT
jgi:hypothetical protein